MQRRLGNCPWHFGVTKAGCILVFSNHGGRETKPIPSKHFNPLPQIEAIQGLRTPGSMVQCLGSLTRENVPQLPMHAAPLTNRNPRHHSWFWPFCRGRLPHARIPLLFTTL